MVDDSASGGVPVDRALLRRQREHWDQTFAAHPDMYGTEPSVPARAAADLYRAEGAKAILELGAGQGRDALFFARQGFRVQALDVSADATAAIAVKVVAAGLGPALTVLRHDARESLPFSAGTFDACYAHMLLCMALTTAEIERLVGEVGSSSTPCGAPPTPTTGRASPGATRCTSTAASSSISSPVRWWSAWPSPGRSWM